MKNIRENVPVIVDSTEDKIQNLIHYIRGQQVMIDSDLAMLYNVETKRLNESVKRNAKRFPESFCFQLTEDEYADLRSQIATSNTETENASSKGGRRYLPYAFTEQGIAMLSAVLRSDEAIQVGKPVYLICQSGLRSYIASRILEGNGYETYNFSGGFRFYDAVVNDRALIERAYACGMDY